MRILPLEVNSGRELLPGQTAPALHCRMKGTATGMTTFFGIPWIVATITPGKNIGESDRKTFTT